MADATFTVPPEAQSHGTPEEIVDGRAVETAPLPHVDASTWRSGLPSSAQLSQALKEGQLWTLGSEPGADKSKDARVAASVAQTAQRMHTDTPTVLVVPDDPYGGGTLASGYTNDGAPYIATDKTTLVNTPEPQLHALMALELSRLAHRDAQPDHKVASVNDPTRRIADADTLRADHEAAGPTGTCKPEDLAAALKIGETMRITGLKAAGGHGGPDPEHPPLDERLASLARQKNEQDASGVCRGR